MKTVNKELEIVWVEPSVSCVTVVDLTLRARVKFW